LPLLGICGLVDDWAWVQETYLGFIEHENVWVAGAAINGLGHLARIARRLDKARVLAVLRALPTDDPFVNGKVADAIADIEHFV